jgi:hypothetical protein
MKNEREQKESEKATSEARLLDSAEMLESADDVACELEMPPSSDYIEPFTFLSLF